MALKGSRSQAKALTFIARGVTDSIDGTDAPQGSMLALTNLVPAPDTPDNFVCRPAAQKAYDFAAFNTPKAGTAMIIVGTRIYGMISTSDFAGHDVPFCFDTATGLNVAIANVTSANTPVSPITTGDWTPPQMEMVATRIIVTHPGFSGTNKFGWIDLSSFSSSTITGDTHSNTTIDNLSTNVLLAGWQVGQHITGTNIPANTFITAIAVGGLSITISNAATGSTAGATYTVTGGTTAAPLWGAGNTNGTALATVATSVFPFNGRAWYATGNNLVFSDSLNPLQVTNATQVLTLGDSTSVTALGGLPLNSTTQGGIIQSLIAFKGAAAVYQITGDQATNNLVVNNIAGAVGTLAPNTIASLPLGLAYIAPDGLRIIDTAAHCSDPIGGYGQGVSSPFIYAVFPSRMAAAYHHNTYRVTVQNGMAPSTPFQEFWFNFPAKCWTGPHGSMTASIIEGFDGLAGTVYASADFMSFATGVDAALWYSSTVPQSSSVYVENSNQLSVSWTTSLLPDNQQMAMNAIIETAVALELPVANTVTLSFSDERGTVKDTTTLAGSGTGAAKWGTAKWGSFIWGAVAGFFAQYPVYWHFPLVFKQGTFQVDTTSAADFAIGNLYLRYQVLGYLLPAYTTASFPPAPPTTAGVWDATVWDGGVWG